MKFTDMIAIALLVLSSQAWSGSKNFFDVFNEWYLEEPRERERLADAILDGDFVADFRIRYEDVEESFSPTDKGAQALTIRSKFRYETMQYELLSAAFGFVDNRAIPDDSSYNSLTNNESDDAIVSDPESTELNEAWLSYNIINTLIRYGQQPVEWDNTRFIGSEEWRQLGQSFSGLTLKNEYLNYVRVQLALLNRAESVLGEDAEGANQNIEATLANIQYRGFINSVLSLYSYDIDNDSGNDLWDTRTLGLRFSGKIKSDPVVEYAIEYASQEGGHDNPSDYSADYNLFEFGVTYEGVRVFGGREVLGADGVGYFVAPLGNKHDFQGYADRFNNGGLGNIPGGIRDSYYSLGYVFSDDLSVVATMHDFSSDDNGAGSGSLGEEFDLRVMYRVGDFNFVLKYSDYQADNFASDVQKLWVSASLEL